MDNKKRIFFPNLDGLRTFAFLAVFLAHSFWTEYDYIKENNLYNLIKESAHLGILGVNFFFVLSGFLITFLLLNENALKGKIDIKAFYIRRILRIWPLYYLVVVIGFFIVPFVQAQLGQPTPEKANLIYYLFFISNFDQDPTSAVLGVLWSIAVEEQFYLVWPIIFSVIKKEHYKFIFPALILVSLIIKVLQGNPFTTANPFICMSDMAIGGWVAYLAFTNNRILFQVTTLNRLFIIGIYIIGFGLIFGIDYWRTISPIINIFDRLVLSLFFAFIIIEQNYAQNSFFKSSNLTSVSTMGAYTYSLYMLHFIVIYIVNKAFDLLKINQSLFQVIFLQTLVSLIISLLVAYISYNYFEKYFLTFKNKFSYISK